MNKKMTQGACIIQKQIVGWVQAFITVLLFYGWSNVAGRYAASVLEVNAILYSCAAFASCALVLLLAGGSGAWSREAFRSVETWVYGIILMVSYILEIGLLFYVTSTEGSMLQKISVFVAVFGSWFFFSRKPLTGQLLGLLIVLVGVFLVFWDIQPENKGVIALLMVGFGVCHAVRVFAAEIHRPHAQAVAQKQKDPKARARVIGFVMFVISVLFTCLVLFVAALQELQGEVLIVGFPMVADFFNPASLLAGLAAGLLFVAPLRLLEFASSHAIKAENFMAVTALSFVGTLFWEWATHPLTGLSLKSLSGADLFAGVLITAGGLTMALSQIRQNRRIC